MAATLGSGERWTQGTRSRTGGWDKAAFRRDQGCDSSDLKAEILGQMEAWGKMLSLDRVRVAVEDGPGQRLGTLAPAEAVALSSVAGYDSLPPDTQPCPGLAPSRARGCLASSDLL